MKSPELKDRLEESEKLIQEMTVTWEEKLRKTEEIAQVCVWGRWLGLGWCWVCRSARAAAKTVSLKVGFHSFSSLFPMAETSGFVLGIEIETPCVHPAAELCIFLRIHTLIQCILITGTPHSFPLTLLFTS